MSAEMRADVVTAVIDAEDLLESVRSRQREGLATTRRTLILEAVGSVEKNCEVMHQPSQSVFRLLMALYAATGS